MALPPSIFGSNLTDLQSGTNAAQGLDYSRANAQDAINQARLEAFLRLRGQQATIQAQQNSLAQERAMRMAELAQQNQQFGTSESNRMKLADVDAASRLAVAHEMNKGMAPGIFENSLAYNQQQQLRADQARSYSAQRKALIAEEKAANDYHYLWANGTAYKQWKATTGTEPNAQRAAAARAVLEQKAGDAGFTLTADGGYEPVSPNLITMPGGKGNPPINPNQDQPAITPAQTPVPAMLQGGGGASGLPADWGTVPGSPFDRLINGPVAPPVDSLTPSTVPVASPNRTIRIDANGNAFYVQ